MADVVAPLLVNTSWNPSDKAANITLSGSNLVATNSTVAVGNNVRAVDRQVSGKYYWEVTPTVAVTNIAIGIANPFVALNTITTNSGTGSGGAAWYSNGTVGVNNTQLASGLTAFTVGTVVCVALDLNAQLIWFRVGAAGNWNGSAGNNPATGVGGYSIPFGAGTSAVGPVAVNFNATTGSVQTANFGDSAFSGTVPTGFTSGFPTGTPTENINVSQAAREALVSGTGSLNVHEVVREGLVAAPVASQAQPSVISREVMLSDPPGSQVQPSVIAREVLLSQQTQGWVSVVAREVLLTGGLPSAALQTAVTVSVA